MQASRNWLRPGSAQSSQHDSLPRHEAAVSGVWVAGMSRGRPRGNACTRGHTYTPESTRMRRLKSGREVRVCKTCHAEDEAKRYVGKRVRLAMPADFVASVQAGETNVRLCARYGVSGPTVRRWRAECGAANAAIVLRALPEDFAETAAGQTIQWLCRHYGASVNVVRRWRRQTGLEAMPQDDRLQRARAAWMIPAPADLAEHARSKGVVALSRHYRRDERVVRRWLDEAGIEPFKAPSGPPKGPPRVRTPKRKAASRKRPNPPGTVFIAQAINHTALKSGREEDAAQHLRRFCAVYRCTERGGADAKGKFWRVGNAVLTAAELIARAERKGWSPDAWERIAA